MDGADASRPQDVVADGSPELTHAAAPRAGSATDGSTVILAAQEPTSPSV